MRLVFRTHLINSFLPSKNILGTRHFFLILILLLLSFSSHTFSWACGSLCEPWKFFSTSLFVHSFVCTISHLFLNGFHPNFYQHFSHIAMLYLSYVLFSACKKHLNLFVIARVNNKKERECLTSNRPV